MLVELQISRLIIIEEFQSFLFSLDTFLMVYEPSRDFSLSVAADLEVVAGTLKLSTPLAANRPIAAVDIEFFDQGSCEEVRFYS